MHRLLLTISNSSVETESTKADSLSFSQQPQAAREIDLAKDSADAEAQSPSPST